jgi:hypothetical protein
MVRLLKQPLLHFLLLGALLFVWNARVSAPTATDNDVVNDNVIVVDRTSVLDYLQDPAKAFDPASFNQQLDAMTASEKQKIVADYVREEAL